MHYRDHADSEYVLGLYVGVDRTGAEYFGNKFTHPLTHSLTQKHTNPQLCMLVEAIGKRRPLPRPFLCRYLACQKVALNK